MVMLKTANNRPYFMLPCRSPWVCEATSIDIDEFTQVEEHAAEVGEAMLLRVVDQIDQLGLVGRSSGNSLKGGRDLLGRPLIALQPHSRQSASTSSTKTRC